MEDHEELPNGWADEINPDGLVVAPKTVTCIGCKTTFAASLHALDGMLESIEEVADSYDDDDEYFDDDDDEFGGEDYFYKPDWDDV